jgi:hypothetical protein
MPYQPETNCAEQLKRFSSAMSWLMLSFGSGRISLRASSRAAVLTNPSSTKVTPSPPSSKPLR